MQESPGTIIVKGDPLCGELLERCLFPEEFILEEADGVPDAHDAENDEVESNDPGDGFGEDRDLDTGEKDDIDEDHEALFKGLFSDPEDDGMELDLVGTDKDNRGNRKRPRQKKAGGTKASQGRQGKRARRLDIDDNEQWLQALAQEAAAGTTDTPLSGAALVHGGQANANAVTRQIAEGWLPVDCKDICEAQHKDKQYTFEKGQHDDSEQWLQALAKQISPLGDAKPH